MAECTELLRSTLRVLVFVFAGCVFVFAGCVFVLAVFGGVHWEPLSPSYHSSLPHQAYPSRQLQSDRDRVPLFATDRSPHFHLWCISIHFPLALQLAHSKAGKWCCLWPVFLNKNMLRISCWLISPRLVTWKEDWFCKVESDRCLSCRKTLKHLGKFSTKNLLLSNECILRVWFPHYKTVIIYL